MLVLRSFNPFNDDLGVAHPRTRYAVALPLARERLRDIYFILHYKGWNKALLGLLKLFYQITPGCSSI